MSTAHRSKVVLQTFPAGKIVPVHLEDIVPGDKIKASYAFLLRLRPMTSAPMQDLYIRFRSFFVPYRILWHDWIEYAMKVLPHSSDRFATEFGAPVSGVPMMKSAVPFFSVDTKHTCLLYTSDAADE